MDATVFSVVVLFVLHAAGCAAVRVPLGISQNGTTAFECGKPYGPCGMAIPSGVTCPQGPGYCQAGHFCGWKQNTQEKSSCLPLPENCGKAGSLCCPSNTDSPHTSQEDKLKRKPFCKDGSTCFYFAPMPGLDYGDIYAGNTGECGMGRGCGTGSVGVCCRQCTYLHYPTKACICIVAPRGIAVLHCS